MLEAVGFATATLFWFAGLVLAGAWLASSGEREQDKG
jgi:hypothetical protein